jgi:hypothetical protein
MARKTRKKTREELRAKFIEAHKAWEAANRPAGFRSGEVARRFEDRYEALMELVEFDRKKDGG